MANSIGVDGLVTNTQQELVEYFTDALQDIYGADINLSPNSPDGQWMMIIIQAILDEEDLITQVNAQFDPDQAVGDILDQRCAINGIQRQAGTYTVTNVTVTTTSAVTLYGKDQEENEVYTVADSQGNEFELIDSISISPGANVLAFQAAVPGAVLTVPNTITVPVSIILGVTSVNNPTTYTTLGINEETDAELKVRRMKSVSLSSQGYLASLYAALLNITGMQSVNIYENNTGSTDGDGIPSHSIWVIVSGTAAAASIANAIYTKRNAGCGLKGAETFNITQVDGSIFVVKWDDVDTEDLFIKFTASSLDGVNPPNIAAIKAGIIANFVPGVYEQVNVNELATVVQDADPNTLVTSAGFSTTLGGSYTNTLTPSAKNKQFVLNPDNIIITPIVLLPTSAAVDTGEDVQFTAIGGYGALTFTIHVNNSGGTIGASSGLYTAGVTPATDTIRVTDASSNFTAASVVVS